MEGRESDVFDVVVVYQKSDYRWFNQTLVATLACAALKDRDFSKYNKWICDSNHNRMHALLFVVFLQPSILYLQMY